uniref:Uncharacterized protein n=1 Tax=Aegilops tauschii TaxID=37682 RepID=M8BXF4_AEGTA
MVSEQTPVTTEPELESGDAAPVIKAEEPAEDGAPVVEDVKEGDGDEDEEEDEDDDEDDEDEDGELGVAGTEGSKQSRSEKKSRKAMMKLGMKPVTGVSRITIKRAKNADSCMLLIKSWASDPVRGVEAGRVQEPDVGDAQAAQQFRMQDLSKAMRPDAAAAAGAGAPADEEEVVDETGIEARDIDLVMTQASVSRAKAVKALKAHDGDIVSAIMELTA